VGIGTFTKNLFNAMLDKNSKTKLKSEGFVVAMNDNDLSYKYPEEVKLTIRQQHQADYLKAAEFINLSGADLCVLQHEFGIYGGESGVYILPLLHRLDVPVVVTLHTILETPSYNEKLILIEICKMAQKIVVMTLKAIEFLIEVYQVPEEKIELIEHGVPDIYFAQEQSKKEFKLQRKKVLLTFGFIGRNKGIETVIRALPKVIDKYPDVIYIVLGKTHPNVLRHSGEEYRIFLMRLVKTLRLEKHVVFLNEFIDEQNLFKYLYASDIYITPYLNEAQITSGTLSYAVGVGAAVMSTPYWHAVELLADGRGKLFNFNDSDSLSSTMIQLLDHPSDLRKMKKKALDFGRRITWPKTGEKYVHLVTGVAEMPPQITEKDDVQLDLLILPPFSLAHINRLDR
jgi:glycosyltransferase involved in cell wall biosynthesis